MRYRVGGTTEWHTAPSLLHADTAYEIELDALDDAGSVVSVLMFAARRG